MATFSAELKMSITFGLLAVVALTVVMRCSAVAGDASWTTLTKCLENELNNSTKDTLECVKIQACFTSYGGEYVTQYSTVLHE